MEKARRKKITQRRGERRVSRRVLKKSLDAKRKDVDE
jgi:hypothetical protein